MRNEARVMIIIWRLMLSVLLWAVPLGSQAAVIDPSRRIDWSQVGIPGGIPNRTTVCTTINAATYGNGTADATTAIQNALDNCPANQVVYLSAGTYRINGSLRVPSNVTLRGAGPQQTILDARGSGEAVVSLGQSVWPSAGNSVAITGGMTAGSSNITVSSASGITVGSCLMITQFNDPSLVTIEGGEGSCTWCDASMWNGTRALGQIVEVTSINGTNISIAPFLYINYSASFSPLATRFSAGGKYAGVEDLQVYANNTGYTANFKMAGAAYSWVKNVEGNYADGDHVQALFSYRGEIRDSHFHDAFSHTSGQTDADVFIAAKSSGFLVENNVLRRLHASIMLNWGAAGNVLAYNYSDGQFDQNATNVLMYDLAAHGAHPMFNLWEGNIAASLHPDGTWGSSSHNTAFRNWIKGTTPICDPLSGRGAVGNCHWAVQANRAMNIDFASLYYNLVGNVVGSNEVLNLKYYNGSTPMSMQSFVIWPEDRSYDGVAYSFSFGYGESGDGSCGVNSCSDRAYTTALLHGNYDYVAGATAWNSTISDHNLPASLYLLAKPSWFGSLSWPTFGPDPSNPILLLNGNIPAKYCYDRGLMPNCLAGASGDTTPPSIPQRLRVR